MLARRFTAQKIELDTLHSSGAYGTAYADIILVRRVQAICQTLGVHPNRPHFAVDVGDLRVTFEDVRAFLNLKTSYKNTNTFHNLALKVRQDLKGQQPAAMLVKDARLLRQLDLMFRPQLIGEDNTDPAAAETATIPRAQLVRLLNDVTP